MKTPILLLLLGFGALAATGCSPQSSLERTGAAGTRERAPRPMPTQLPAEVLAKLDVRFLDGEIVAVETLLGRRKVIVLNLWATWCGPCRREIPELTSLDREYQGKDVEIVGLSVEDAKSATEVVRMFGTQYSIRYRLGFASDELFDAFSGPGRQGVVPQTFIFGKAGDLILHLRGLHPDFREIVRETIEKALG